MSVKVISWVWEASASVGNERLVLLAIADRASDDGLAWPDQDEISRKTRLSRRTVQRSIASLEAIGELSVERERGEVNRYRVQMSGSTAGRQIDAGESSSTAGRQIDARSDSGAVGRQIVTGDRSDAGRAPRAGAGRASAVAHSTSGTSSTPSTHTSRAREPEPEQPRARMPIIAKGETLAYDRQGEKAHRGCHPEVCRWRDPKVRTCLPTFLLDELASKLFGVSPTEALGDVIAWARADAPPAGYVAPGDTLGYWRERWSLTRASVPERRPGARSETTGRVVEGADATDALLARLTNGEALR